MLILTTAIQSVVFSLIPQAISDPERKSSVARATWKIQSPSGMVDFSIRSTQPSAGRHYVDRGFHSGPSTKPWTSLGMEAFGSSRPLDICPVICAHAPTLEAETGSS